MNDAHRATSVIVAPTRRAGLSEDSGILRHIRDQGPRRSSSLADRAVRRACREGQRASDDPHTWPGVTEQRLRHRSLAGARFADDTQDLTGSQLEAYVLEDGRARLGRNSQVL